jgi:uncharacterized protein (DUF302 family)
MKSYMQRIMTVLNTMVAIFFISTASIVIAGSHGDHSGDKHQSHDNNPATNNGLVIIKSNHTVIDTADKLEALVTKKGMTVFARIDHSAGAKKVEKSLRPTELIIFGNPKVGTPLMQCEQSIAIDLPQKMLIWEDSEGVTWLGYNDPQHLKQRHQVSGCDHIFKKITGALRKFATAASQ